MFNDLPFEIRYKILQNLRASELLVCLQTCHSWYNLIKSQHLITRLETNSPNQLYSIIRATKAGQIKGDRVESLQATRISNNSPSLLPLLPGFFPALSTFVFDGTTNFDFYSGTCTVLNTETAQKLKVWEESLKKLVISAKLADISTLFKTCHFHHLTELSLWCCSSIHEGVTETDPLLESITNMPQLRSLTFECIWLTFAGIELIHRNLPSLEKLQLKVVALGVPVENIRPATNITDFSIFVTQMPVEGNPLLQYITAKYTSLVHLHMSYDLRYYQNPHTLVMDFPHMFGADALVSFISQLPSSLKYYRNELAEITPSLMTSLINAPFKLSQLHFNPVQEMSWYTSLSDANLLNTLQDLSTIVYHMDHVYQEGCIQSALKRLKVLCRLNYYREKGSVMYLDSLCLAHPNLEALDIIAPRHDLKIKQGTQSTFNITDLTLRTGSLSNDIMPFIRHRMPYLKRLVLLSEHRVMTETTDNSAKEYIDLRHHCLEELKLNISSSFNLTVCSINGKHYRYFKKQKRVIYCGTNSSLPDDGNYYLVDIECRNLNRLTVNETMII